MTLLEAPPPEKISEPAPRWRSFRLTSPAEPLSASWKMTLWIVSSISVLALWALLYAFVFSGLQQHRDNANLYDVLRESLSKGTLDFSRPVAPGSPIAVLQVPDAHLHDSVVVEGTSPAELMEGVGHLRSTPMPGQVGESVLFGRALTFGAPFGDLKSVPVGGVISVTTPQGEFHYVVGSVESGSHAVRPMAAGESRLMLLSSSGSIWSASSLVYVEATLKDKPVAAGATQLGSVPAAEQALGSESRGLPQLIFWLQAALAAALLTAWAASRWGAWQAWILGTPVVLAALWGATGQAMLLMPNLL